MSGDVYMIRIGFKENPVGPISFYADGEAKPSLKEAFQAYDPVNEAMFEIQGSQLAWYSRAKLTEAEKSAIQMQKAQQGGLEVANNGPQPQKG